VPPLAKPQKKHKVEILNSGAKTRVYLLCEMLWETGITTVIWLALSDTSLGKLLFQIFGRYLQPQTHHSLASI
jgi:hypothetical protein